ncbi:MAG: geranylgeranylglyceryl/heptaprenylglyceryl phosphate synthase [Candidatus Bathyarchaeia archaeon]
MIGKTEKYILDEVEKKVAIHMTLIDPEKVTEDEALYLSKECEKCGTSAIMIGGSTIVSTAHLDSVIKAIKNEVKIPVILFPNNITGLSQYADAVWFMSLLNSADPYFIIGVQVLAAPLIKKFHLETIPLGYLIVGEGGTAAVIGKANPIPYNKPELSAAHALAAQYLGMHFVYLEGGSGVNIPVPAEMVHLVKNVIDVPLIVGGGIRTGKQAEKLVSAGADILVTGTIFEQTGKKFLRDKIVEILEGLKEGVKNRHINKMEEK